VEAVHDLLCDRRPIGDRREIDPPDPLELWSHAHRELTRQAGLSAPPGPGQGQQTGRPEEQLKLTKLTLPTHEMREVGGELESVDRSDASGN